MGRGYFGSWGGGSGEAGSGDDLPFAMKSRLPLAELVISIPFEMNAAFSVLSASAFVSVPVGGMLIERDFSPSSSKVYSLPSIFA